MKLPLFDYEGWAEQWVKQIRAGQMSLAEAIGAAEGYARDVRDVECVYYATASVGGDAASAIRKHCGLPAEIIARYQEQAARELVPGSQVTDRKLKRFLRDLLHEVRAAQAKAAARRADLEVAEAEARQDEQSARRWRAAAANLDAAWRSI